MRVEIEIGGSMAQKGLRNITNKSVLEDRGSVPKEEGELIRQ